MINTIKNKSYTYGYRLRFYLSKNNKINIDAGSAVFTSRHPGMRFTLKAGNSKKIKDSNNLLISNGGYSTWQEAYEHGQKIKILLMLISLNYGIGFDFGNHDHEFIETLCKRTIEDTKIKAKSILDDRYGLCVYPEVPNLTFISVPNVHLLGSTPQKLLKDFIKKNISSISNIDDRLSLALEIYQGIFFEYSDRAKFLILINVIECLSSQEKQPANIIALTDKLIKHAKESLQHDESQSYISSLGKLKYESIFNSCHKLIEKHLDLESAKYFKDFYKIRSKMLHKGEISSEKEMHKQLNKLRFIVDELLKNIISMAK